MTRPELRKILAEFFENPAVAAMWTGLVTRKGGTRQEAETVIGWLAAWANKDEVKNESKTV